MLGIANLFGDGFSMAVSNYQGTKSEKERLEETRRMEEDHIRQVPEGEREEIRQIFAKKGFEGSVLEEIVRVVTEDTQLWIDTMLMEEHHMRPGSPSPFRAAATTFAAFLIVGAIPLIAFWLPSDGSSQRFLASTLATGGAFIGVGVAKGVILGRSKIRAGLETFLAGGLAAGLAYLLGHWLRNSFS